MLFYLIVDKIWSSKLTMHIPEFKIEELPPNYAICIVTFIANLKKVPFV